MKRLRKYLKILFEYFILFGIGGVVYYCIELLWRGHSHVSMIFVGGLCFIIIGLINKIYDYDMSIISQTVIAGLIITIIEFIFGLILNKWLGLNIWDYSDIKPNFMGQICLSYTYLWQWLSIIGIVLDDYIRWLLFKEEKPKYKIL